MATMIGDVTAETLTDTEALALGVSSIVHGGELDPDNEVVNARLAGGGLPQTDKEGRPIISYRQYEEISRAGGRLDQYAMRMIRPGYRGTWVIQASKYLKWFGLGYEGVGCPPEKTHMASDIRREVEDELRNQIEWAEDVSEITMQRKAEQFIHKHKEQIAAEIARRMGRTVSKRPVRTVTPVDTSDEITIFYCKDKYPECSRFFDNDKGLKFHWRKDHESAIKSRKVDTE